MSNFEIKRNSEKEFYFTLKAGNNQQVLVSTPFPSVQECKEAISAVRRNIEDESTTELTTTPDGKFSFTIAKVILGKVYKSEMSRKNGIKSVRRNIAEATGVKINPIILR